MSNRQTYIITLQPLPNVDIFEPLEDDSSRSVSRSGLAPTTFPPSRPGCVACLGFLHRQKFQTGPTVNIRRDGVADPCEVGLEAQNATEGTLGGKAGNVATPGATLWVRGQTLDRSAPELRASAETSAEGTRAG